MLGGLAEAQVAAPGSAAAPVAQAPAEAALPEEWRGSSTLAVVASDETGAPVSGVAVTLRLGDSGFGFRGLETDADGKAELEGLAAGEWQIDLQREGFMLITAWVRLEPGEDPEVAFSSRQRTGSFWAPLNAVYLQAGEVLTAAVKTGRAKPKQARKEVDRQARRERKEEERLERLQQRGRIARVVPSEPVAQPDEPVERKEEAVAASAPAQTTPEAVVREAAEPEDTAAKDTAVEDTAAEDTTAEDTTVEDTAAEVPEPGAAEARATTVASPTVEAVVVSAPPPAPLPEAAAVAAEEQTATPADEPVVESQPSEPAAAVAEVADTPSTADRRRRDRWRAPPLLPNPDLLPAGACPECRPGEWSLSVRGEAAPRFGESACRAEDAEAVAAAAARLGGRLQPAMRAFAGPLQASDGNDVLRQLDPDLRRQLADHLEGPVGAAGSCPVVAAVIPAGARYIGFRYQAAEAAVSGECLPDQDCQIGDSRWLSPPVITRTETVIVVHGQFDNRSTDKTRYPRLTVYFVPPRGWLPPK